ncbi:hypothetical protein FOCC_FOCC014989 [Frankliniella occidentalis]|nr:hypothetical protein FOCC_FOCC014989 [Frankliniella occidentalis]
MYVTGVRIHQIRNLNFLIFTTVLIKYLPAHQHHNRYHYAFSLPVFSSVSSLQLCVPFDSFLRKANNNVLESSKFAIGHCFTWFKITNLAFCVICDSNH